LVRPHVVFPDQLPADFKKSLDDNFPGSGDTYVPIDPANWTIITDGMAAVTEPAYFHTAGSAHLEGIDIAGKTGTAQQMSHQALEKTSKGKSTYPNVWFVGLVPRRNPELVVAVLWQSGEFSYFPARLGAQVVAAYVNKKRRLAGNLPPEKSASAAPAATTEVGAVWTVPNAKPDANGATAKLQSGHFYVDGKGNVTADAPGPTTKGADAKANAAKDAPAHNVTVKPAVKPAALRTAGTGASGSPEVAMTQPARRKEP
jgi:membrane peptidoglycan carboxypeptidase